MTDIAHLVTPGFEIGDERDALCGEWVITRTPDPSRPICHQCYDIQIKTFNELLDDRESRIDSIITGLSTPDVFNSYSWINPIAEEIINNAIWKPGPGRPEGPAMENGYLW